MRAVYRGGGGGTHEHRGGSHASGKGGLKEAGHVITGRVDEGLTTAAATAPTHWNTASTRKKMDRPRKSFSGLTASRPSAASAVKWIRVTRHMRGKARSLKRGGSTLQHNGSSAIEDCLETGGMSRLTDRLDLAVFLVEIALKDIDLKLRQGA